MNYFVNENVKKVKRIYPMQGRNNYYRYDMNENPEGLPKEFIAKVLEKITPEFLSMYPETDKFLNKYAEKLGINVENILTTNGSDMAIRYLLQTFCKVGNNVVTVSPTFEMYRINCELLGLNHIPVEYEDDFTISIEKICNAVNDKTDIVVLVNPNNPIGNIYEKKEIEKIIQKAEEVGAIVIIDEAYHYFYSETSIKYALEKENVIILRTFSKLLSLAACRLGVIIASEKIIEYTKRLRLTFDTNSIALLFGESILDEPDLIKQLIKIESEGKKYIINELRKNNYECKESYGNFIFIKTKKSPCIIAEELEKEKVLVHAYGHKLLKDYLRISTGSTETMNIFLNKFLAIDK